MDELAVFFSGCSQIFFLGINQYLRFFLNYIGDTDILARSVIPIFSILNKLSFPVLIAFIFYCKSSCFLIAFWVQFFIYPFWAVVCPWAPPEKQVFFGGSQWGSRLPKKGVQ